MKAIKSAIARDCGVGRTTVDGYLKILFDLMIASTEVDFIIYDDNDFVPLEVKNAARLDSRDFAGLKAFQSDYPEARAVLLYRGETQYMHGNVLVVPVAKYLSSLVPGKRSPDVAWRR